MAAPSGTGGILADVTDGGDETDMLCASNRLIRGGSLITLHGQESRAELGVLRAAHDPSARVLVATESAIRSLTFRNTDRVA